MLNAPDFFDLQDNEFAPLFENTEYVWEALKKIKPFIREKLNANVKEIRSGQSFIIKDTVLYRGEVLTGGFTVDNSEKLPRVFVDGRLLEGASIIYGGAILMDDNIYIGSGVVIEPAALIKGPTYIGDKSEVRHAAYIRGDVLVGRKCVVGHTTEIKGSVMLGESKAGHFAYIGDSILGSVNLGAGTKLANLKMIDSPVTVVVDGKVHQTGLRKFGAILGDGVETGCNSVTAPGTLLGRKTLLYANGSARGYYPQETIIKVRQNQAFGTLTEQPE